MNATESRVILYTGKGGVGKTSIAAANASLSASRGSRTLLVSSDTAHNLSDVFERPVGEGTVKVSENLHLLEVKVLNEIRENWDSVQQYFTQFLSYLGVEAVIAEEVALFPGTEELFLLTRILREIEEGDYDAVIVDAAPTASTLRLLTFSDSSSRKLNKIMSWERKILKLLRPLAKRTDIGKKILPADELYETFGSIISKIGKLGDLLKNPKRSSLRLVLNPDPIAVAETRRTFTYLSLFGFPVDGIFVNKLLPAELADGYFENLYREQRREMEVIEQSFLDTRIFSIPYLDKAPLGQQDLTKLGEAIFHQEEPGTIFSRPNSVQFAKEDDRILLTIRLPNISKDQIDIGRKGNELIIQAEASTRLLQLPDSLSSREVESAKFDEGMLTVGFGEAGSEES